MSTMIEDVNHLTRKIGARPAGTEEERVASLYIGENIQKRSGLQLDIEDFEKAKGSFRFYNFTSIFSALLMCVAILLPIISIPAFIICLLVAIVVVLEYKGKNLVSNYFKYGISQNVVSKYIPAYSSDNPQMQRKRKVVLLTYYDSGRSVSNYNTSYFSFRAISRFASIIAICIIPVVLLIKIAAFSQATGFVTLIFVIMAILIIIVSLIPILIDVYESRSLYNEGANCNASANAALMEIARQLGTGAYSMYDDESQQKPVIHGKESADFSNAAPRGADVVYDVADNNAGVNSGNINDPLTKKEESLAQAKAALEAFSAPRKSRKKYDDDGNVINEDKDTLESNEMGEDTTSNSINIESSENDTNAEENDSKKIKDSEKPNINNITIDDASADRYNFEAGITSSLSSYKQDSEKKETPSWYKSAQNKAKKEDNFEEDKSSTKRSRFAHTVDVMNQKRYEEELKKKQEDEVKREKLRQQIIAANKAAEEERRKKFASKEQPFFNAETNDDIIKDNTQSTNDNQDELDKNSTMGGFIDNSAQKNVNKSDDAGDTIKVAPVKTDVLNNTADIERVDESNNSESTSMHNVADTIQENVNDTSVNNVKHEDNNNHIKDDISELTLDERFKRRQMENNKGAKKLTDKNIQSNNNISNDKMELDSEFHVAGDSAVSINGKLDKEPKHDKTLDTIVKNEPLSNEEVVNSLDKDKILETNKNDNKVDNAKNKNKSSFFVDDGYFKKRNNLEFSENVQDKNNPTLLADHSGSLELDSMKQYAPLDDQEFISSNQMPDNSSMIELPDVVSTDGDIESDPSYKKALEDSASILDTKDVEKGKFGTGSFAAVSESEGIAGATGTFAPVTDELIEDASRSGKLEKEGMIISDADDSVYKEGEFTDSGAFAGKGYMDMPSENRKGLFGFLDRRHKKGKHSNDSDNSFFNDESDWDGGGFSVLGKKLSKNINNTNDDEILDESDDSFDSNVDENVHIDAPITSPDNRISTMMDPVPDFQSQIQEFHNSSINIEVWLVALGAEVDENSGIKAFLMEHAQELRGSIIIELEGLGAGELSLVNSEGYIKKSVAPSRIKRYIRQAANNLGVAIPTVDIPWGRSSARYASNAGFKSIKLVGVDNNKPAYYMQKDDVLENIDENKLKENVKYVLELIQCI